jgi:LysM repeat protein
MVLFKRKFKFLILFLLLPALSWAQKSYHEMVEDYIEQYKDLAVAEQLLSGVPAAITLAQGIYETGAGSSELCLNAANHFGIKCKQNWTGATYSYSDDQKDECFRKYKDAAQSYRDHSDFLKNNPRYRTLFQLDPEDYEDWARGLKSCGYATNPLYAQKIIQTITDYHLQEYTTLALDRSNSRDEQVAIAMLAPDKDIPASQRGAEEENAVYPDQPLAESKGNLDMQQAESGTNPGITAYYETTRKNGLKGFYARKGDLLLEYAIRRHIRYARLLEWNDMPDAPMTTDIFVYLEPKRRTGLEATCTVMPGMNLLQISQEKGIQLEQLRKLNLLAKGENPVAGTILHLQKPLINKPEVYPPERSKEKLLPSLKPMSVKSDYIYVPPVEDADETIVVMPAKSTESETIPVMQEPAISKPETTGPLAATGSEETPEAVAVLRQMPAKQQLKDLQKPLPKSTPKEQMPPAKPESEMTPLERLKKHMDQVVYGRQQEASTASDELHEEQSDDASSIATLPANRQKGRTTMPAAESSQRFYKVQSGDTAFGVAKKFGITLKQLRDWNQLPASMVIQKGLKLRVAP